MKNHKIEPGGSVSIYMSGMSRESLDRYVHFLLSGKCEFRVLQSPNYFQKIDDAQTVIDYLSMGLVMADQQLVLIAFRKLMDNMSVIELIQTPENGKAAMSILFGSMDSISVEWGPQQVRSNLFNRDPLSFCDQCDYKMGILIDILLREDDVDFIRNGLRSLHGFVPDGLGITREIFLELAQFLSKHHVENYAQFITGQFDDPSDGHSDKKVKRDYGSYKFNLSAASSNALRGTSRSLNDRIRIPEGLRFHHMDIRCPATPDEVLFWLSKKPDGDVILRNLDLSLLSADSVERELPMLTVANLNFSFSKISRGCAEAFRDKLSTGTMEAPFTDWDAPVKEVELQLVQSVQQVQYEANNGSLVSQIFSFGSWFFGMG